MEESRYFELDARLESLRIRKAGEDPRVLAAYGDKVDIGAPMISGAQVVGEVVEQTRGAKVISYKKKPRNTYRRKLGHRQSLTVIKITDILAKGGAVAKKSDRAPEPKAEAAAPAKKAKAAPKAKAEAAPAKAAAKKAPAKKAK